jgi:FkbM family methyltransferase
MKKFFIEIGSCDFDTLLPLARQGWEGIIVEPIKYYLDRLERLPGVIYENCAISAFNGKLPIKRWDPAIIDAHGQSWMHGVSNLDTSRNVFSANPEWKKHEIVEEVQSLTLNSLIEKHGVTKIDFLKVDAESHEAIILNNYDFRIKPTCILVEHIHCGEKNLRGILEPHGYLIYREANDLYCIG